MMGTRRATRPCTGGEIGHAELADDGCSLDGTTLPIEARARAFYDVIAADYDRQLDTPAVRAMRECFWRSAEALLPQSSRILDFGAGTGTDAQHFAALGHHVTAYDISEGMIDVLERRCALHIRAGAVEAIAGPLAETQRWLVDRAPFDAVICNFAVFSMIPKPERLFRLFGAVVRRGGFALVCIQNPWNAEERRTRSFWRALLAKPFTGTIRYRSAQSGFSYRHTPAEIRRAARPEFAPDMIPDSEDCRESFGLRAQMRLVRLRRV